MQSWRTHSKLCWWVKRHTDSELLQAEIIGDGLNTSDWNPKNLAPGRGGEMVFPISWLKIFSKDVTLWDSYMSFTEYSRQYESLHQTYIYKWIHTCVIVCIGKCLRLKCMWKLLTMTCLTFTICFGRFSKPIKSSFKTRSSFMILFCKLSGLCNLMSLS